MIRVAFCLCALSWSGASMAASPFVGSWRGHWRDPQFHQSGSVSIVVAANGRFSSPIGNDAVGLQGVVSGTISAAGTTQMTYSYDGGQTTNSASGFFRRHGSKVSGEVRFTASTGQDLGLGTFELSDTSGTDL